MLRKKIVIHLHGGNYSINNNIPYIFKFLIMISISLANQVIIQGDKEKKFLKTKFKINLNKITVLPNSVNIPKIIQKPESNPIVILYMGRIHLNKGLSEMITALELIKNEFPFKFIVAGDGPDKEFFLNECKKRLPGKYEYCGIISGLEKEKILMKSKIFLLVSYYEGLPYALLEAMAYKMVPIVTSVGSIPEIIEDGKNGFLVVPHDYKSVYYRIIELLENPNRIEKIGQSAYDTIKAKFALDNYIVKINCLYQNILNYKNNTMRLYKE